VHKLIRKQVRQELAIMSDVRLVGIILQLAQLAGDIVMREGRHTQREAKHQSNYEMRNTLAARITSQFHQSALFRKFLTPQIKRVGRTPGRTS
jgi:hypothetical protein